MLYVDRIKNDSGAYHNPQYEPFNGCIELDDIQSNVFLDYNGFVIITEKNGKAVSVEPNTELWESWKASVKEPAQETSKELREKAYNTQAIISFDGEMLTVTQASQKWQYYAAEGNTEKTDELTALIAEAKAKIREQYPDE